jgi:hypothetical protein
VIVVKDESVITAYISHQAGLSRIQAQGAELLGRDGRAVSQNSVVKAGGHECPRYTNRATPIVPQHHQASG